MKFYPHFLLRFLASRYSLILPKSLINRFETQIFLPADKYKKAPNWAPFFFSESIESLLCEAEEYAILHKFLIIFTSTPGKRKASAATIDAAFRQFWNRNLLPFQQGNKQEDKALRQHPDNSRYTLPGKSPLK